MDGAWSALLMVLLFLGVTAAAGVAAVVLKGRLLGVGYPGLAARRRMRLVERLELGERRFVALVRLDDRELVLGGGPQEVNLLESREAPADEPSAEESVGGDFVSQLSQLLKTPGGLVRQPARVAGSAPTPQESVAP